MDTGQVQSVSLDTLDEGLNKANSVDSLSVIAIDTPQASASSVQQVSVSTDLSQASASSVQQVSVSTDMAVSNNYLFMYY